MSDERVEPPVLGLSSPREKAVGAPLTFNKAAQYWAFNFNRKGPVLATTNLSFNAERSIRILLDFLESIGIRREKIVELKRNHREALLLYFSTRSKAVKFIKRLEKCHLQGITCHLKYLHKKDWQDKWKKGFKPFSLTKNLTVIPAWLKRKFHFKKVPAVYMDTGLAFGTGLHETTRFMVRLIEDCSGKFDHFLDIGTGTGILTIVALHCGAQKTMSLDISPDAVKTAKINIINNGYQNASIKIANIKNYHSKSMFDFVAANLITHDLIQLGEKILSLVKPGKFLAVSGISLENMALLKKAFRALPLRCLKVAKGTEWAAILYKRVR